MNDLGMIPTQVLSFLWSVAVGGGLGLLYDAFRIARLALPSPVAVVGVQDILFGILAALVSFGVMLTVTEGRLRLFLLVGEGVGWVLYANTLSIPIMAVSGFIISVIKGILGLIWSVILMLGRLLHRLFVRPVLAAWNFMRIWILQGARSTARRARQGMGRVRGELGRVKQKARGFVKDRRAKRRKAAKKRPPKAAKAKN